MIFDLMLMLGGVTVFVLGLRFIGENVEKATGKRLKRALYVATANPFSAALLGMGTTAVAQSSVAIDMAVVSLADAGAIPYIGACAVVMGANIGTTVTAQLVSFSFSTFSVTALGSLVCFIGVLLSGAFSEKYASTGNILIGFGLIFIGIEIMTEKIVCFYDSVIFQTLFSSVSLPIMLLNGIFVTAICRSSSVVTSILVILAADGKVDVYGAMFLMLGANIGSCFAVIDATKKKGELSKSVAVFNLLFNVFGAVLFIAAFAFLKNAFSLAMNFENSPARAVANFHTFFNTASAILLFPFIKPLGRLSAAMVFGKKIKKRATKLGNAA